jgi:Tfp pilus assembly protein PilN
MEVRGEDLLLTMVRIRPNGIQLSGRHLIQNTRQRPADDWVSEYRAFIKKLGASHVPCVLLLPRRDSVVRIVSMPGVTDKDLDSAVRLQLDSLHPFREDEVVASWARVAKTGSVLVTIAKRDVVEQYAGFAQAAGIRLSGLMPSAAAIYSALRMGVGRPESGFLSVAGTNGSSEFYGESDAKPLFSAAFDTADTRAVAQALAELRLAPESEARPLSEFLPAPQGSSREAIENGSIGYAAAIAAGVPWLAMPVNLLPEEMRFTRSRLVYVPTAVLALALLVLSVWLVLEPRLQRKAYLAALESELSRIEPVALKSAGLEKQIESIRNRTVLLDQIRQRTKADLEVLNEMNKLLPPPAWVNSLDVTRTAVNIAGESDQAAALLKQLDQSPLFQNTEFTGPPVRTQSGQELFRIKAAREGVLP